MSNWTSFTLVPAYDSRTDEYPDGVRVSSRGCGCCADTDETADPTEAIELLESLITGWRVAIAEAGQVIKMIKDTGRIPSGE